MPTYEYTCRDCGEDLEVVQSFTDDPLTTCPKCGGSLRKVFGSVGIVFKGSGFYKTDSRDSTTAGKPAKDKSANGASSDTSSDSGAAGGSGSSSEKPKESSPSTSDSKTSAPAPAPSTSAASVS